MIKALALDARGVYIGRPFLYGLGAGGKAGVTRCLEIIRNELDITTAFCGHRDIRGADERNVWQAATARAATLAGEPPGQTAFP